MSQNKGRAWPRGCNILTITPAHFEECLEKDAVKDIDPHFLTNLESESTINERWINSRRALF